MYNTGIPKVKYLSVFYDEDTRRGCVAVDADTRAMLILLCTLIKQHPDMAELFNRALLICEDL